MTAEPEGQAQGQRPQVLAYVPEGYSLRRRVPGTRRPVTPPPKDGRALALGIAATLVVGIAVGYIAGFAVARQQSDAVVNVTVHQSTAP